MYVTHQENQPRDELGRFAAFLDKPRTKSRTAKVAIGAAFLGGSLGTIAKSVGTILQLAGNTPVSAMGVAIYESGRVMALAGLGVAGYITYNDAMNRKKRTN